MDLIYANADRQDIGVLNAYKLDMAYGDDENSFTCEINRKDHCCEQGFFIYVENEEYGGIVDSIKVDTGDDSVTYIGRTWHGILENKVICPEEGNDYLLLDGEANEVLQQLIDQIGLSDLFIASSEDSEIDITSYQMDRYIYGYTGIRKMLKDHDAKLRIRWQDGMIVLSAEPIYDYSQDEEFDTSQVDFNLRKNYRPVNHMICLGQGELKNRAVIHIFTDENGGVQQYLQDPTSEPLKDADYILDTSQQVLTGEDEVVEILDYPNAAITKNYTELTSRPSDWAIKCDSYFYYEPRLDGNNEDTGGTYKNVEWVKIGHVLQKKQPYDWAENFDEYYTYDSANDRYSKVSGTVVYNLLASKPGNWDKHYEDYFVRTGSTYKTVDGVKSTTYRKQKKRPSDWKKNYNSYYYLYNDGTTSEYRRVNGYTWETYDRQSHKPSDWATNYSSYYRRATAKELEKNKKKKWYSVEKTKKKKVPAWKPKKYYTRHAHTKAPKWGAAVRYTRIDRSNAPTWSSNTYYAKKGNAAPTWSSNTYYSETDKVKAPVWSEGEFFREYTDQYADMVAEAVERLTLYHASDDLSIDLAETEQVYDIGDIVGTIEHVTGMEAIQEVIKKIVRIDNDDIVISYEVG